jgi:hypothetical protein
MLNRNAGNGHFAIFLFPTHFSKNSCKDKTSFPNRRIKIILFLKDSPKEVSLQKVKLKNHFNHAGKLR